ncbi:hypothetical protein V8G54_033418 [Vigna mungo]|uniref:Uncharacterized protein n=1 Tax=Vigna mungo TaxID=3915 RepID=A0AAQ3RJR3_VIGMU
MKGDWYDELVEVFYYNVKEFDGNIHSRVKGVDIVIDDDIWWKFIGLKNEVFKEHILEVGMSEGHRVPYGVFISKVLEHYGVDFTNEKKQICGRENLIGKATLTCIGMKRTSQG